MASNRVLQGIWAILYAKTVRSRAMKRIAVALSVLTVLVLAAPAGAELCEKCKGGMYIMSVGKCVVCGGPTRSGAHKLCPKCSAKLGQCEHCRAPLKKAGKPTTQPAKIDINKPGMYTSGKWEYKCIIKRYATGLGCSCGGLTYDGKPVADNIKNWDRIKTPWGTMVYAPGPTNVAGWVPIDSVHALAGRMLPSPEKSTPAYLRALELDESANGKTVSATVGQNIIIRLKGNATTGYSWVVGKNEGDVLGQVGKVKYVSDQPPMPVGGRGRKIMRHRVGGGGKYVFTFTAKKAGKAKLSLEYKRGWEKNKPPAKTFTLNVTIKADPTAERVKKLKANINSFQLVLRYRGPQNELLYRSLVLGRISADVKAAPGFAHIHISGEQAEKVIAHLVDDGFLCRAFDITNVLIDPPGGPLYSMQVNSGKTRLNEYLGWDLKMLKRLDGLRKVLDGDAAKAMDKLLKRLENKRKEWKKKTPVKKS